MHGSKQLSHGPPCPTTCDKVVISSEVSYGSMGRVSVTLAEVGLGPDDKEVQWERLMRCLPRGQRKLAVGVAEQSASSWLWSYSVPT